MPITPLNYIKPDKGNVYCAVEAFYVEEKKLLQGYNDKEPEIKTQYNLYILFQRINKDGSVSKPLTWPMSLNYSKTSRFGIWYKAYSGCELDKESRIDFKSFGEQIAQDINEHCYNFQISITMDSGRPVPDSFKLMHKAIQQRDVKFGWHPVMLKKFPFLVKDEGDEPQQSTRS